MPPVLPGSGVSGDPAVDSPVLFYDSSCGFCSRVVQFVLRHEPENGTLRFAPLDGAVATALRRRQPWLATVDSLVWWSGDQPASRDQLLVRSDAALGTGHYLGGPWKVAAVVCGLIPRRVRDSLYSLIARHRHSLAASNSCVVPSESQRARFI